MATTSLDPKVTLQGAVEPSSVTDFSKLSLKVPSAPAVFDGLTPEEKQQLMIVHAGKAEFSLRNPV